MVNTLSDLDDDGSGLDELSAMLDTLTKKGLAVAPARTVLVLIGAAETVSVRYLTLHPTERAVVMDRLHAIPSNVAAHLGVLDCASVLWENRHE